MWNTLSVNGAYKDLARIAHLYANSNFDILSVWTNESNTQLTFVSREKFTLNGIPSWNTQNMGNKVEVSVLDVFVGGKDELSARLGYTAGAAHPPSTK